jgi:ribosomal protein S18 acetylase RimI-like enzyme
MNLHNPCRSLLLEMKFHYHVNRPISIDQFIQLIEETTLSVRRPVDDKARIGGMLKHADILVTAWHDDTLVGVARSVTDYYYCCYLSDLAVSGKMQSKGIGKELIRHTFNLLKKDCKLILLSAPQAAGFYHKIGFTKHDSAWTICNIDDLN